MSQDGDRFAKVLGEINNRLDRMENNQARMQESQERMQKHLGRLEENQERMQKDLGRLEERQVRLERNQKIMLDTLSGYSDAYREQQSELGDHESRIVKLEQAGPEY